jgi:hypothetical protein
MEWYPTELTDITFVRIRYVVRIEMASVPPLRRCFKFIPWVMIWLDL